NSVQSFLLLFDTRSIFSSQLYSSFLVFFSSFFFQCSGAHRDLHSFPTRRSSDLFLPICIAHPSPIDDRAIGNDRVPFVATSRGRSEEHTSELQSRGHLVCRLLLEKKKIELITQSNPCIVNNYRCKALALR